jgi:outer membrane protein assembly factor BamB
MFGDTNFFHLIIIIYYYYYCSSFFVGVSSLEEDLGINSVNCCYFQGSFLRIDLMTGDIKWKILMLPFNHGSKKLYAGAAVWGSSPSIDIHRNLVFIATGNLYRTPDNVTECEQNRLKEKHPIVPDPCVEPDDHSESIVALDLENGTIRWSHNLGGYDTWNLYCLKPQNSNCPPIPGTDADFGEAPALHTIWDYNVHPHSRHDLAIVGQKNGFIWALDRDDGHIVWATVKVHSLFYMYITYHYTLGSISPLINPLNIQMKLCENMNIRVLKTIKIITSCNIDNFVLHI